MNRLNWKKAGLRAAAFALGGALLLPGLTAHAAAANYTATDSDTFWKLSKKFNIPLNTLMAANPKVNPYNIYAGLKLTIPSGSVKVQAAQTVTTMKGESLAYKKVLQVKASAYSASVAENAWGPVDYFGKPLKLGTIAVDPKIIPLGSKVYITGYDFNGLPKGGMIATATDSGSAIKGNRIDIFIPGSRSYVSKFGMQNVKVYVLK
ncbi:LysM peptidoglycan-binding domain-containing protein [Cohnella pontilimi]|uniref:LysM peptidoglycan-binding domain-containing protein n=1 Tax=Cohnella pontilimi TaxID=2564100 RepID=A0A4U0F660_9BACL|nr:3D domain-containing protein [Cohnella pontilimi]TJY39768.1 LysM peptidoglycan-binding domain-containing protein [Cohnella pontilimi]